MQTRLPVCSLVFVFAFAACSGDDTSPASADGGGSDAARTDGSAGGDSGGGTDSGSTTDAGGGADTGGNTDTGAATDSAVEAGAQPVNGCGPTEFAASDHTAGNDPRAITFPADGQGPAQYSIPCMHIKVGQTVTWNGGMDSAAGHPLEPSGGDSGNPIALTATGTTVSFAFPSAGVFGFHCANHPSTMLGAIDVTP